MIVIADDSGNCCVPCDVDRALLAPFVDSRQALLESFCFRLVALSTNSRGEINFWYFQVLRRIDHYRNRSLQFAEACCCVFPPFFPTIVRAEMTMPLQYSATVVFKDDRRKLCMLGCISDFHQVWLFCYYVCFLFVNCCRLCCCCVRLW